MENLGLIKNQKKPRRRTHRRKLLLSDSPMDMAKARREIVNALHIHRSSSWMMSSLRHTRQENSLNYYKTNMASSSSTANTTNIIATSSQLSYPLVESVQLPEPIWSTTEPAALLAAAPPPPEPLDQVLEEFEWPENNISSSYNWWFGFLNSLDSGNYDQYGGNQPSNYSAAGSEMENVSSDQNEENPSPETYDQWLTTTTSGDEVELL